MQNLPINSEGHIVVRTVRILAGVRALACQALKQNLFEIRGEFDRLMADITNREADGESQSIEVEAPIVISLEGSVYAWALATEDETGTIDVTSGLVWINRGTNERIELEHLS